MVSENPHQTFIKVSGSSVVIYSSAVCYSGRRCENGANLTTDRKKAYKGQLTDKSISRVKKKLYAWLYAICEGNKLNCTRKIKPAVITLTLSSPQQFEEGHDDKYIKKHLLELFLKQLQYKFGVVNYFWRAEAQQNGNIHFHIIVDRYIDKIKLQSIWNSVQEKFGYIDPFFFKYNHRNPPSTQIETFSHDEKGIDYLIKYVLKDENYRLIEGLQLRFSNSIGRLVLQSSILECAVTNNIIDELEKKAEYSFKSDYFQVFYFDKPAANYFNFESIMYETNQYYKCAFLLIYKHNLPDVFLKLLDHYFNDFSRYRILRNDLSRYVAQLKIFDAVVRRFYPK